MGSAKQEKAALIVGIEADARVEEERILKEAENQVAEKRRYAEKRTESILNDARKEAQRQAEAAKKKIISGVELEVKRRSMCVRDAVMRDILSRVEKKLNSMVGDESYRSVLISWITEAVVGLGAESPHINASDKERTLVDAPLLSQVGGEIYKLTGRQTALTLSDAPPLKSQGVVLTAADGRTAFNNQVKTRMQRSQRKIRMLIYDALFDRARRE